MFCMVLHGIAWYYMILNGNAPIYRYTCSQQMSPVIAFDIAVVAQKVKVQLLYNGRHAKSEKVGGVLDH